MKRKESKIIEIEQTINGDFLSKKKNLSIKELKKQLSELLLELKKIKE